MVDRAAPLVLAGRRLARATSLTAALFLLLFAVIPPRVAWLPAAHAATGPVISMDGGMNPATVTVTPGITVTWTSTDGQKHRVRSTSGPTKFDSGGLNPGQSFTFTFGSLGTYAYVDDEHKNDPSHNASLSDHNVASLVLRPGSPGNGFFCHGHERSGFHGANIPAGLLRQIQTWSSQCHGIVGLCPAIGPSKLRPNSCGVAPGLAGAARPK